MQQHDDKLFQAMLTRARRDLLNNNNVAILNNKIALMIPILNLDKQVVIVQQNATWHTINWIQTKRFPKAHNHNIIFFLVEHLHIKKDSGQIVDDTDLLTI